MLYGERTPTWANVPHIEGMQEHTRKLPLFDPKDGRKSLAVRPLVVDDRDGSRKWSLLDVRHLQKQLADIGRHRREAQHAFGSSSGLLSTKAKLQTKQSQGMSTRSTYRSRSGGSGKGSSYRMDKRGSRNRKRSRSGSRSPSRASGDKKKPRN
ncbi:hypothetical protein GGF32_001841 [Allomyces javanicus]|nr:hypothetical protein GGF32_001841 [Allomyces javanicus]